LTPDFLDPARLDQHAACLVKVVESGMAALEKAEAVRGPSFRIDRSAAVRPNAGRSCEPAHRLQADLRQRAPGDCSIVVIGY
jgi:hypothetical protein